MPDVANFNALSFFLGFLFSGIGFVYFSYGKKMGRPGFLITGIFLMAYVYFIDAVWAEIVLGLAGMAFPHIAARLGWIS